MKKLSFKKMITFIIIMIVALAAVIFFFTRYTNKRMTAYSFQRLEEITENRALNFYNEINTNYTILNTMALAFSTMDFSDTQILTDIFNTYSTLKSSHMKLFLLTSEGMMLDQTGNWTDASEYIDFETEKERTPYLSGRCTDPFSPDTYIMYETVPVIQNGETVAILFCTLSLQELSNQHEINDFNGNALIMLVDGSTGDILIDTWHTVLGNILDYTEREYKYNLGDTVAESLEKMGNNEKGDLAFISNTTKTILYLHYEPVGISQLSAVVGVEEHIALANTREITYNLYFMSALIAGILIIITVIVITFLLRVNHNIYILSTTDRHTGLLNRSSYETYISTHSGDIYPETACIYLDVNGLHELNNSKGHAAGDAMLLAVADAMRNQWPDSNIYRIGGDEFVLFPPTAEETVCLHAIKQLQDTLQKQNYYVSVGFARMEQEMGLSGVVKQADENMLKNKAEFYKAHNRRSR